MDTSAITAEHAKIIERLAREGKSIHEIGERTDSAYTYDTIQAFMWEHDCITLQGAKKAISIRTRKLIRTTKREEREALVAEIDDFVQYIYYAGKYTQRKLDNARKKMSDLRKLTQD